MIPRPLRAGRSGALPALAAALAAALLAAAVPAARAAAPRIQAADVVQHGPVLKLRVTAAAPIAPARLTATQTVCLVLDGPGDPGRLCVVAGRLVRGSDPVAGAVVERHGERTLTVEVPLASAGVDPGRYAARVVTVWDGAEAVAAERELTITPARLVGCEPRGASLRTNGPRDRKVVALTFDDGPAPITPRFLDVLEREHVPGTFFMIGQQVAGRGPLLKRMLRGGSIVADHSWNHANLAGGGARAMGQLRATNAAIRRASGFQPCLFRAPYGAVGGSLAAGARSLDMLTIQWDVDPTDWRTPGAAVVASRILGQARPGSIILMHDGGGPRGGTLAALPRVIAGLRRRGYRFATVPELLGLRLRYA